jgi:hypothetical protein
MFLAGMAGAVVLAVELTWLIAASQSRQAVTLGELHSDSGLPASSALITATFLGLTLRLLWPALRAVAVRIAVIATGVSLVVAIAISGVLLGHDRATGVVAAWLIAGAWLATLHVDWKKVATMPSIRQGRARLRPRLCTRSKPAASSTSGPANAADHASPAGDRTPATTEHSTGYR